MHRGDRVIILDSLRFLHYLSISEIPLHRRGGVGVRASKGYTPSFITVIDSKDDGDLAFITEKGKFYRIPVKIIWDSFKDKGKNIKGKDIMDYYPHILNNDCPVSMFFIDKNRYDSEDYLVIATIKGRAKKIKLSEFKHLSKPRGVKCITFSDEDDVVSCTCFSRDGEDLYVGSSTGFVCRFSSDSIASTKFMSQGVIVIELRKDEAHLSTVFSCSSDKFIFSASELSKGKLTVPEDYRLSSRGRTRGIISLRLISCDIFKSAFACSKSDQIICINSNNFINRFEVADVPIQGRNSFGVKILQCYDGQRVVDYSPYSP